jgi:FG-GAP repeat
VVTVLPSRPMASVVIGASGNDGNGEDAGQARIYEWSGIQWTQVGSDLNGEASGDLFGLSVAISGSGNTVAVGAPGINAQGEDSGYVRIFDWSGSQWTQVGADVNGEAAQDFFGWSVSLSGDGSRVAIGGKFNDGIGVDSGHVRVYDWAESQWTRMGSDLDGEAVGDKFGESVTLSYDGDRLAVGASSNGGNGDNAGHVRIFDWTGNQWLQRCADFDGEAAGDMYGESVSLSADGSRLAIGVPGDGSNSENAGQARIYDLDVLSC